MYNNNHFVYVCVRLAYVVSIAPRDNWRLLSFRVCCTEYLLNDSHAFPTLIFQDALFVFFPPVPFWAFAYASKCAAKFSGSLLTALRSGESQHL